RRLGDKGMGRQGEKGSYEVMKLGRWEKRREIPNDKTQIARRLGDKGVGRQGEMVASQWVGLIFV
ncbi:hypothetical protein KAS56_06530, partial [candidate division WOR-3 bacterium]|nr:hypothetical protein [candidate division WOR-3 bacterium]